MLSKYTESGHAPLLGDKGKLKERRGLSDSYSYRRKLKSRIKDSSTQNQVLKYAKSLAA